MRILLLLLISFSTAFAETPYEKFSTYDNFTNKTIMVWEQVDNIQEACEAASRKYGNGGYGYKIDACSFWFKNNKGEDVCRVLTPKQVNMWTIGHEMRHCFQGRFHE